MYYVMVHLAGGAVLLLAFEYTGRKLARLFALPSAQTPLPTTLHFALGAAVWASLLIALGMVGLMHASLIRAGVGAVALLAGIDGVRRFRGSDPPRFRLFQKERWTGFGPIEFAALVAITGPLVFYYLVALDPQVSWDADNYHLVIPRLFLEHGGFRHVSYSLYGTWPLNTEMLFALAMSFQDYILAKTLHFAFGVFLAVAIFETTRRLATPVAGLLALVLFLTERLVRFEVSIAYVDLAIGLYLFLGYLIWQRANFEGPHARNVELKLLFIVGICAAFFAGSKLTGAIIIVIFVAMQLAVDLSRRRDLRSVVTNGIVIVLPALVLAVPWYVKSWVMIGDPLHPGLYPIFQGGGDEWSPELARAAFEYHASRGMGRDLIDYLLLPARLIGMLDLDAIGGFGAAEMRGSGYKAWWAGILPFLVWGAIRLRSVRQLLVPVLIYFVYWAQSSQIARLLLPVLPFLCCAAGISVAEAATRIASRIELAGRPRIAARLVAAGPGIFALIVASMVWINHPLLEYRQLTRILSQYSAPQDEIIARAVPEHFAFINASLPEDARVMMFNYSRGFFCERDYIADSLFAASQMDHILKGVSNREELFDVFARLGISHVLFQTRPDSPGYPGVFRDAMRHERGLKLVYRAGKIRIFEVVGDAPGDARL